MLFTDLMHLKCSRYASCTVLKLALCEYEKYTYIHLCPSDLNRSRGVLPTGAATVSCNVLADYEKLSALSSNCAWVGRKHN